ncbi:MAG: hypothetical protein LBP63_06965 [Prevotellaceae bacterium]|jgi:hypothetical protein|nr:hypothetical protein [Prevotellaceae bacterium]
MQIEFTEQEIKDLKKFVSNLNLYYESEDDVWNFNDLEDQRQLAIEIVRILNDKF